MFTGAFRGEYYQLSFNDLLSASDASDADQDPISFRIESIENGVLEKQVSGFGSQLFLVKPFFLRANYYDGKVMPLPVEMLMLSASRLGTVISPRRLMSVL